MFELLDKIFEEFGVEFDTTKHVDSFSAIGYDGKKVIFNKNDYIDYGFKYSIKKQNMSDIEKSTIYNDVKERHESIYVSSLDNNKVDLLYSSKRNYSLNKHVLASMVA